MREITEDYAEVLADETRARVAAFWARGMAGGWPIDALGFTFLGRAISAVGAARFPEQWTGREPWEAWQPNFDGTRRYISRGYDEVAALSLLRSYRPERPEYRARDLVDTPLSPDEWHEVETIYREHKQRDRQESIVRLRSVSYLMSNALAAGRLEAALRVDGSFLPLEVSLWADEGLNNVRYLECQMDRKRPLVVNRTDPFASTFNRVPPPALVPGNEWIFVKSSGLAAFLGKFDDGDRAVSSRAPPLIKQEIRACLKRLATQWTDSGSVLSAKTPLREFQDMITDQDSPFFIPGAKRTWARDIWERHSPPIWRDKRGPPVDQ